MKRRRLGDKFVAVLGFWSRKAIMRATTSCQEIVCISCSGISRRKIKKSRMCIRRLISKKYCMDFHMKKKEYSQMPKLHRPDILRVHCGIMI